LERLVEEPTVLDRVVGALERESLLREQAVDDLDLLLEDLEPFAGCGNGNPCVRCSSSHHPAPIPISTLPPEM